MGEGTDNEGRACVVTAADARDIGPAPPPAVVAPGSPRLVRGDFAERLGVTGLTLRGDVDRLLPSRLRHRVATVHAAVVPLTGEGMTTDVDVLLAAAATISSSLRVAGVLFGPSAESWEPSVRRCS